MANLTFVTGGARSGKSRFAESSLASYQSVTYIATAKVTDEEMAWRIAKHRESRPARWLTCECPLDPAMAIRQADGAVLLDCLSIWVSNLLLGFWEESTDELAPWPTIEASVLTQVQALLEAIKACAGPVVIVSNEVGSGLVPSYKLGRAYRDLLGMVNQQVAAVAERAFWCVSGLPVLIKGARDA